MFTLSLDGRTEQVLHPFTGSGSDGASPRASAIVDSGGNLYGTATTYGSGSYSGSGVAFELTSGNTYINLHAFTGSGGNGANPWANLYSDPATGNLYGTTVGGGQYGYGLVFKLAKTGGSYTYSSLYSFTGGSDGANPYGTLTMDSGGNLYGTTVSGGANGKGVVFKFTP